MKSDDTGLELDGGAEHKKPSRKAWKKIQIAHDNQAAATGEQEISKSLDGDDTATLESTNVDDGQTRITSSLGREVKMSSTSVDGSLTVDGPRIGPGSASYSEGAMSPSKRVKLMPIQSSLTSEELDVMCGVTIESGMCCQGPLTCKLHSESSKHAVIGRKHFYDILLEEQKAKLVHGHELRSKRDHCLEIPVPLATKIYYSRQNQWLRTKLGHLYRESLTKETSNDASSPKSLTRDNAVQSAAMPILSPDNGLSDQQKELLNQKKKELSTAPLLRKSKHMLPPSQIQPPMNVAWADSSLKGDP